MKSLWPAAILLTLVGCAKEETISFADYGEGYAPCEMSVPRGWKVATEAEFEERGLLGGLIGESLPRIMSEKENLGLVLGVGQGNYDADAEYSEFPKEHDPRHELTIKGQKVTALYLEVPSHLKDRLKQTGGAYYDIGEYQAHISATGKDLTKEKLSEILNQMVPRIKCD